MLVYVKSLYKIAGQINEIDPLMARDFVASVHRLSATDREFLLQLNPEEKALTSKTDKIKLVENRTGGWDWIHTDIDGHGSSDITGWRLKPSEVIGMIEKMIVPGPAVNEIIEMLKQDVIAGDEGISSGKVVEEKLAGAQPPTLDVASESLIKQAIHMAYSNPQLRPCILAILKKII